MLPPLCCPHSVSLSLLFGENLRFDKVPGVSLLASRESWKLFLLLKLSGAHGVALPEAGPIQVRGEQGCSPHYVKSL